MHPADLLAAVQRALVERSGIDPAEVGQVVGGCVSQVGEQTFNITRTAWLHGRAAARGRGHHRRHASAARRSRPPTWPPRSSARGVVDVALGLRRRVDEPGPDRARPSQGPGRSASRSPSRYFAHYEITSQFEGAERIAEKWGITRDDTDAFGLQSQQRAAQAWAEGRFDAPDRPDRRARRSTTTASRPARTHHVARDEGLRETSLEKLADAQAGRPTRTACHTAGTSSQITDGAARRAAHDRRARPRRSASTPRARIVDTCLVGVDPVLMLTGPIDATRAPAGAHRAHRSTTSTLVEINEAFASVVLAWAARAPAPTWTKVNPNGGAIALGHPLGGTGAILLTKALHELERTDGSSRSSPCAAAAGSAPAPSSSASERARRRTRVDSAP